MCELYVRAICASYIYELYVCNVPRSPNKRWIEGRIKEQHFEIHSQTLSDILLHFVWGYAIIWHNETVL